MCICRTLSDNLHSLLECNAIAFPLSRLNCFTPTNSLATRTMGAKGPFTALFPIRVTILVEFPTQTHTTHSLSLENQNHSKNSTFSYLGTDNESDLTSPKLIQHQPQSTSASVHNQYYKNNEHKTLRQREEEGKLKESKDPQRTPVESNIGGTRFEVESSAIIFIFVDQGLQHVLSKQVAFKVREGKKATHL